MQNNHTSNNKVLSGYKIKKMILIFFNQCEYFVSSQNKNFVQEKTLHRIKRENLRLILHSQKE